MKNNKLVILYLGMMLAFSACSSSGKLSKTNDAAPIEEKTLEEMVVVAPQQSVYNGSEKRENDLLHTRLDVSFDWQKKYLNGKATLTLMPYFYPTATLVLDAKGFDIHSVRLLKPVDKTLTYTYDGKQIFINLDKTYQNGEEYTLEINYTAKPDELEVGGSAAITADKGLYFINADGSQEGVPQQIWTQGETESSSCWFPTIDSPNERCTQEMYITVDNKYVTLSNGILVNSAPQANGKRTDYWKMDKPHAPYLFMMGVGSFEVIKDKPWRGREVNYYLEKDYAPYAKEIFGNTPEMLDFYSNVLGVEYPWSKFSQIVVREFVSGAMENTTAVVHFDGLNLDDRDLLDETHEDIVAHELFHHWFGDLVTCESWANIPLNESFATYGEYLWIDHKYGKDQADYHINEDLNNYLAEATHEQKYLIRYYYDDKEDMFDAHSYQKGGRVLHMLRNYVGDEAFFKSLQLYLQTNAYHPVEIHNLRLAFEQVTGEDLNWFFNQWFLGKGHPELNITPSYDAAAHKINIKIEQVQAEAPFMLPLAVDIYEGEKATRHKIMITGRNETFSFDCNTPPSLVNVDAEKVLLGTKNEVKSAKEYAFQYNHAKNFIDKLEAVNFAKDNNDNTAMQTIIEKALGDKFWAIRDAAIDAINVENTTLTNATKATLEKLATQDEKSDVRAAAVKKLSEMNSTNISLFQKALEKDQSYRVNATALKAIAKADETQGLQAAKSLENSSKGTMLRAVADVYGKYGTEAQLPFFAQAIQKKSGYTAYQLISSYGELLSRTDNTQDLLQGIDVLKDEALNNNTWWVRYAATNTLSDIRARLTESNESDKQTLLDICTKAMNAIFAKETNPRLKGIYQMMQQNM
ncbi:MAG: M1 family aminopeptidase [Chitinophagales bacterium]|nr:hypothetical protein [Bacteroidota bacterium]